MNMAEAQEIILAEIKQLLDTSMEIDIEEDLKSLGLDSGKTIRLLVKIEEMFAIELTDEDLIDDSIISSVQSLCIFLQGKNVIE